MALDLLDLTSVVFDRIASDAAGAAVRAALGSAQSIVHADELVDVATAPARPLIALQRGPVPRIEGRLAAAAYTWYVYDSAPGYYRIDRLLTLLEQAYDHETTPLTSAANAIGDIAISTGVRGYDTSFNWRFGIFDLTIYAV